MKLLKEILYKCGLEEVIGSTNVGISSVCFDSRKTQNYSLFVATKGEQLDGHQFIDKAIASGAIAIVCEKLPEFKKENIVYIRVRNSAMALGNIASNFYDNPSSKLKVIGITGTNGKTTTATLLYSLFRSMGKKTGLISTVVNKINDEIFEATHTTPDAIQLNGLFSQMLKSDCTHCFMEVSSHAVVQHRITGIEFAAGVFTNITHDHLDYHITFDEYIKAKKSFFDMLSEDAFALVNKDDTHGMIMLQNTKASKNTFALKSAADFNAKIIENHFSGLHLNLDGQEIWSKQIGEFNAYNLLGIYATARLLGEDKFFLLTHLSSLNPVDGRFDCIRTTNNITGIVDYAHTPDALKNVLKTVNDIRTGNEKIITIVGCGGNRDAAKRPVMAAIACEYSDRVIFTSDNPRNEKPEMILKEMEKGVSASNYKKLIIIVDRREAIKAGCSFAEAGDIILLAGKGHEKYQEINGVKYPFDDKEILTESLNLFVR
jgi:UDP-N-acetylmuramoyl-L-alanyl-D-glutamate--2,6-diaminopimelate ligase